jgi:hypothetical protein
MARGFVCGAEDLDALARRLSDTTSWAGLSPAYIERGHKLKRLVLLLTTIIVDKDVNADQQHPDR